MIEPTKIYAVVFIIVCVVFLLGVLARDAGDNPILKHDKQAWPLAILFGVMPFAIAGFLTGNL